jgi:predicted ATP-binding protein involved in virulence
MRLKTLRLHNFRRFKGAHICEMHGGLTVFAAINGAGKSSILDAVALAFGPFLTRLPKISGNAPVDSDVCIQREKNEPFALIGAQNFGDDEWPESTSSLDTSVAWDRIKRLSNSSGHMRNVSKALKSHGYDFHGLTDINALADYFISKEESDLFFPILAYYGTGRAVIDVPQRRRGFGKEFPRFQAYADCLNPKTNFRKLFEYFYYLEDLERREKEQAKDWDYQNEQLVAIRMAINSFLPEYTRPRTELRPLRFMVDSTKDGCAYDIKLLSDGYKTSLAMVMDIAMRMVEANPQKGRDALNSPGIVLIDEIELHLHPSWQQRIILDLQRTFPKVQFICTTHSPQVLSTVRSESIRTIQEDGRITSPSCKTYGAESKRVLEELMLVESRPPIWEKELEEFVRITDAGDWKSVRYRELRSLLEKELGSSDPAIMDADIKRDFQQLSAE